ncbi:retrovirus-related pol polyprotein from type-1 retrotransposable element r2 [Plakobranchus ocellatus]|uniref:Retrovirus-related pol polyprotein from type-1 retrotransposable element r2 n=1 Tax=Plakobranchus ocellatus TaxID=259542 RepID=A0AAV4C3B0_9GAST|nr:retrovirus-related pol polyprotein from type-1 retrotransposable element r2 [Plakobranchus ocellatus]
MNSIWIKYTEKNKNLYMAFVDLEKAYDRVPRDLVYWCLRKRMVPERLVKLVMATYQESTTKVRTVHGRTESFQIEVGLHQGSGLSPFLFAIVLDTISAEMREGLPKELLFADDLAVIAETEQDLQRRWIIWQKTMEAKGLKVNTGKTEVMVSGKGDERIVIRDKEGETLNQVQKFKYLGLMLGEKGGSMLAVRAKVKAAWEKWREIGPVIGDKKMPRKLKTKLYTTMVRPVILYGAECWVVGQKEEQLLETTEMRMLRRIRGVTLEDKMRSDDIRKELGVCPIGEKARESRLRWFGHVMRREPENHLKQMLNLEVPGRRPRGRPKGRWRDGITRDMKQLHIEAEDAEDRSFWRKRTQAADLNLGTGASW